MDKNSSEIDWSKLPCPLPPNLFDKYTQQSIPIPVRCLGIDELLWSQCRSFALKFGKAGFIDPIAILYTSFKHHYTSNATLYTFTRWLHSFQENKDDFQINSLRYSTFLSAHQLRQQPASSKPLALVEPAADVEQLWLLLSISMRVPTNSYSLSPDVAVLDLGVTRVPTTAKKNNTTRLHCIMAVTPSGRYSNQLVLCKPGKYLKMNASSSSFTHIVESTTGEMSHQHVQQWFETFIGSFLKTKNSALLLDPRTTLLTPEIEALCEKANLRMITTDADAYDTHVLTPLFSLFDQQWTTANRIDKMYLTPFGHVQRIVHTLWFALRTLKQNDQIAKLFDQSIMWKPADAEYVQSLQPPPPSLLPKKRKKRILVKTGSKTKLLPATPISDLPVDSKPEEVLSFMLNRQISIARASKHFGGMKLDYFKYCLSRTKSSSVLTGPQLLQLNTFMQSTSTIDWMRELRSLYFWPVAKQLFLREVYQLTGILTRKRAMNSGASSNIGSIRSCDQQAPDTFWTAFEDLHQIQLDNESAVDEKHWGEDFEQYLFDKKIDCEKTQLWTVDTFEFPLTKKSTILQLPEWNELRPMNLTPKVTVIYAFSRDGQFTDPFFVFPNSLRDETINDDSNAFNELGHLTPPVFHTWIDKHLVNKGRTPMVLLICSRLPIMSSAVFSLLEQSQIYPFGYPFTRTLPFRYLFERRVRNNRSTNRMSELWKKKLLEEQRTHVLKDSLCTMKNIKQNFEEIWPVLIHNKREDDDDDNETFQEKCQQAFQQANVQLAIQKKDRSVKAERTRNTLRTNNQYMREKSDKTVDELHELTNAIGRVKEQFSAAQILKIKNTDASLTSASNEAVENNGSGRSSPALAEPMQTEAAIENIPLPTVASVTDKRPSDENDEPRASKRLRSSCVPSIPSRGSISHVNTWPSASKQEVTGLQSQPASLFQLILSLVRVIVTPSHDQLTDEDYQQLYTTLHQHDHHEDTSKLRLLIDVACMVTKTNLVI